MHTQKFFISWLTKQNGLCLKEVTGLSGLIAELWLIYEDKEARFSSVRIIVQ